MKTVPGDFLNHSLSYSSQTLCNICVITLTNGTVLYFTDLDYDLRFDSQVYRSDCGFNASAVQLALGVGGETQSIEFLVTDSDAGTINRAMIINGRLAGASVVVSWVDYEAVRNSGSNAKLDLYCGYVTGVAFGEFSTAVVSVQSVLAQQQPLCSDKYGATCRYDFGDANCGVDVTPTQDGPHVYSLIDFQTFKATLDEASPAGYYNNGTVAFLDGPIQGVVAEIATNTIDTDGRYIFILKVPLPDVPRTVLNNAGTGDLLLLTAGCDKIVTSGCTYWNNVLRFGGEPFVPNTAITSSSPPPATTPATDTVAVASSSATTTTTTPVTDSTPPFLHYGIAEGPSTVESD